MNKDYDIVLNKRNAEAVTDGLTANHIANGLENYEAARSGFFVFMPSNSQDPVLQLIANKVKEFGGPDYTPDKIQELLKLNVTKAKVPHFSVGVLDYTRGNEQIKFAGTPKFEAGSISVDDIVGVDTKSILEAWLELAYNLETRAGGRMYEYKLPCTLIEYTQDYRPVRNWTLEGCFISSYSEDDFDKSSDAARKISVTIEYDRAKMRRGATINGSAADTEKVAK